MARKKEPEETERVLPAQVLKSISAKKLRELLNASKATKQDVDEIVGGYRGKIALAVEKNNLHKGAYGMVSRLDRLEPGKLADWLDYLDHYLDISGLRDKAATAPRLEMGAKAGEGEGETDEETSGRGRRGTVTQFPTAEAAE